MSSREESGGGSPATPAEVRDWSDLPADALLQIFKKLGVLDVLNGAEQVCRPWRAVAKGDPALWRRVDMRHLEGYRDRFDLVAVARAAVDRADGKLEAYWDDYYCDDKLLLHIAERNDSLKSLCLISCTFVSNEVLYEAIKKFSLLEELELSHCDYVFGAELFERIGLACPQLKYFRLNSTWADENIDDSGEWTPWDEAAFAIAKSMPRLRHLQLIGTEITNKGLTAILDNCRLLETLDIRHCFNVKMNADLQTKCGGIETLRSPSDSIADYEYRKEMESRIVEDYIDDSDGDDEIFVFDDDDDGGGEGFWYDELSEGCIDEFDGPFYD